MKNYNKYEFIKSLFFTASYNNKRMTRLPWRMQDRGVIRVSY